jgi:hypothetical protein
MAQGPSAVATLAGFVRNVDEFDTKPDANGVVRRAARVTVLTEPDGGFAEVYVGPDDLPSVMAGVGDRSEPVAWVVSFRAGNKNYERQDGTAASYAQLWVNYVADAAAGGRRLAATG